MTKFEEKLEILPIKIIQHPVGDTKYYAAVHVKSLIEQADEEIANLKSQLQQQALPVVPELTQKQADILNDYKNGSGSLASYLSTEIKKGDYDYFARAWLDGYTVEKPQLFRLKLKNAPISNYYLWLNKATGKVFVDKKFLDWTNHDNVKNIFTEQEIPKISDGAFVNNEAFELVPVEDGE